MFKVDSARPDAILLNTEDCLKTILAHHLSNLKDEFSRKIDWLQKKRNYVKILPRSQSSNGTKAVPIVLPATRQTRTPRVSKATGVKPKAKPKRQVIASKVSQTDASSSPSTSTNHSPAQSVVDEQPQPTSITEEVLSESVSSPPVSSGRKRGRPKRENKSSSPGPSYIYDLISSPEKTGKPVEVQNSFPILDSMDSPPQIASSEMVTPLMKKVKRKGRRNSHENQVAIAQESPAASQGHFIPILPASLTNKSPVMRGNPDFRNNNAMVTPPVSNRPQIVETPKFEAWTSRYVNGSYGFDFGKQMEGSPSMMNTKVPRNNETEAHALQSLATLAFNNTMVEDVTNAAATLRLKSPENVNVPIKKSTPSQVNYEFVPPPTVTRRPNRPAPITLEMELEESPLTRARRLDAEHPWLEDPVKPTFNTSRSNLKTEEWGQSFVQNTAPSTAFPKPYPVPHQQIQLNQPEITYIPIKDEPLEEVKERRSSGLLSISELVNPTNTQVVFPDTKPVLIQDNPIEVERNSVIGQNNSPFKKLSAPSDNYGTSSSSANFTSKDLPHNITIKERIQERTLKSLEYRKNLIEKAQQRNMGRPLNNVPRQAAVPVASTSQIPLPIKMLAPRPPNPQSNAQSLQKRAMMNSVAIKQDSMYVAPSYSSQLKSLDHGISKHPPSDETFNIPAQSKVTRPAAPSDASGDDEILGHRDIRFTPDKIPDWARTPEIMKQMVKQQYMRPEEIFGRVQPVRLEELFGKNSVKKYPRDETQFPGNNDRPNRPYI